LKFLFYLFFTQYKKHRTKIYDGKKSSTKKLLLTNLISLKLK